MSKAKFLIGKDSFYEGQDSISKNKEFIENRIKDEKKIQYDIPIDIHEIKLTYIEDYDGEDEEYEYDEARHYTL